MTAPESNIVDAWVDCLHGHDPLEDSSPLCFVREADVESGWHPTQNGPVHIPRSFTQRSGVLNNSILSFRFLQPRSNVTSKSGRLTDTSRRKVVMSKAVFN